MWQDFPVIKCPHPDCQKTCQNDDYYDLKAGDYFYCPHCERKIFINQTDVTFSADLQTEDLNKL